MYCKYIVYSLKTNRFPFGLQSFDEPTVRVNKHLRK